MKIAVKLTYDDRTKTAGDWPLFYHRRNVGILGGIERSIQKHYYPNPGDGKSIIVCFPGGNKSYLAAIVTLEDLDTLVASNKSNLTKIGTSLVEAGIEKEIQRLYNGEGVPNPVVESLNPNQFARLEFDWEDDKIEFVKGSIYEMHDRYPKGLRSKSAPNIGSEE